MTSLINVSSRYMTLAPDSLALSCICVTDWDWLVLYGTHTMWTHTAAPSRGRSAWVSRPRRAGLGQRKVVLAPAQVKETSLLLLRKVQTDCCPVRAVRSHSDITTWQQRVYRIEPKRLVGLLRNCQSGRCAHSWLGRNWRDPGEGCFADPNFCEPCRNHTSRRLEGVWPRSRIRFKKADYRLAAEITESHAID